MGSDHKKFEQAVTRFSQVDLPAAIGQKTQQLAREALRGVVGRTPVKTGLTRANWQVAVGTPASSIVMEPDPSGAETIARGDSAIAAAQPFETIWISNNLGHVASLESGSPGRAPVGIVSTTLASIDIKGNRGGKS